MNINKNIIINALKFYDINDSNYLNNCLECVKYIINNKLLLNRVNEIIDISGEVFKIFE